MTEREPDLPRVVILLGLAALSMAVLGEFIFTR